MRQFTLINGSGHRYSLNEADHFLNSPKYLGAKFSNTYEQFDANFVRTKRISKPDDIRGEIVFTGNQYQKYFEFMKFLAVEPLTLEYVSNATYHVSVDLKSIDKSEIEDGVLNCTLRLKRTSRWYRLETRLNDTPERNGKTYDYTYDYSYTEYEPETVTIDSDSGYDSPTKITIFGPCVNPTWKHYLNGDIVATGKVTANIINGRRLVIDCTSIPYSIKEVDGYGTVHNDLYGVSDFSTERFFKFDYGQNRITVKHDGSNKLALAVEARIEYETV